MTIGYFWKFQGILGLVGVCDSEDFRRWYGVMLEKIDKNKP